MTTDEVRKLAQQADMRLDVLVDQAMFAVMTGDPHDPRYSLAWQVWNAGQQAVKENRRRQMDAEGWVYYPRSENHLPITCPKCRREARLTGGRHQHWTCRICDLLQTGYEPEGGDGFWMRWEESK